MQFPTTTASVHTLANGLNVILDADPSVPVVSTQAWVETGSIHEGEFLGAGVSHLVEHMVFKGTENYDCSSISDTVQAAGGEWNAYTTFDRTVYYIDGPADSAETFLKVLTEMVFKPAFPVEEFEKEKDVIRREIDMGLDDPDDRNGRLLYSTVYQHDARNQPVIGHLELFNQITHEQMVQYHRSRYTTENTFLSISGDFVLSEMLAFLEKLTADIARSFTKPVHVSSEPPQIGERVQRESFAVPTSKLTMTWQTPPLEHPDSAPLDLLATIIGAGRSCRLYQKLREQSGLCHSIGAWSSIPSQLSGMFAVSAVVDAEKRDELEAEILAELYALGEADFAEEIPKAVRMVLASQFRTLTTASGRASDLASNWQECRSLNFTRDYLEMIEAVSEEDLRRVAKKYLIPQTLTVTSLDPETTDEKETSTEAHHPREPMQTHVLDNGLTLITQRDGRLPMVSICMATRTGLLSETPETSGVNALLAKLLTKGTSTRSGEEIASVMDSMGASFNVGVGNNSTLTSASCLQPDIEKSLTIIADMLLNSTLPEESITREREMMIAGIREQEEDPLSVAFRKMRGSLFGHTGYGMQASGTEETLSAMDRDVLLDHYKKHFTAGNSVMAIFGDIDPAEVTAWVESLFAQMPTGQRNANSSQPRPEVTSHELHLDKQQAVMAIGFPGAGASDNDTFALELLSDYCTDMAGPLFTKIREDLGLAYFVSATQFHGVDTGMFAFYLGTSPDQLDTAKTVLLDEIKTIAEHGIPEDTLASVKTTWLASHALANQKNGALARLSAIDSLLGFPADHHLQAAEKINKLTAEEVRAAADRFFGQNEPVIVTVTPEN